MTPHPPWGAHAAAALPSRPMCAGRSCRTQTCDLAKGAAGNVVLIQEKTAHEIRAPELAVLRSSAVANPPSEDGAYSALGSGGWLKSPVLWDPGW
jgi:hypothetical protein